MEGRMQLGPREAYGSLGIMHVRTDQWTRARRMFEQVLELDPQTTAARRLLKKLSP
jgi:lipoprotein NlpI